MAKAALCISVTVTSLTLIGLWMDWQGVACAILGATIVVINEEIQRHL